uniref:MCAfunc domain-containing protein n=1 Tax=Oryza barthii TaxID=65489 RepID=A0A0D3HPQ8_9ORYZ
MESLSSVSTIVRIAQEIAGAVSTVSRNRSRCRKLANRVRCIGDLLRQLESSAAAGDDDDEATRRLLDGLEDALHRALELVTSCQDSGCPRSLIAGGRMAGQFDEMDREIDRCLLDLGVANRIQIARLERLLHQNAAFRHGDGDPAPAAVTLRIGMPCDDGVEHIKRRIHTVQAAAACSKDQRLALKDNKLNRNVELVNVKRPVPISNGGGVRKYDSEEKYSKGAGEVRKEKAAAMAVAMANMVVTNANLPFAVALVPIGDVAGGGMYHPASPYSFSPYPQGPPGNATLHRVPTPAANKYGGRGDAMVDADGDMGAGKSVKSFTADSGGGDKKAAPPIGGGEWKALHKKAAAGNVTAIGVPAHEAVTPPSHGYGYWPYAGHGPSDAAAAVAAYYRTFEHMFSDENPNACTIM